VIDRRLPSAVQLDGIEETRQAGGITPHCTPGQQQLPQRG
jgi:hypothetical protein